jgi:hypothetical protein
LSNEEDAGPGFDVLVYTAAPRLLDCSTSFDGRHTVFEVLPFPAVRIPGQEVCVFVLLLHNESPLANEDGSDRS